MVASLFEERLGAGQQRRAHQRKHDARRDAGHAGEERHIVRQSDPPKPRKGSWR